MNSVGAVMYLDLCMTESCVYVAHGSL